MTIRITSNKDFIRIVEFYQRCGYDGESNVNDKIIIAEDKENNIIGVLRLCNELGILVLRGMEVLKEYQRKGIGTKILLFTKKIIDTQECYLLCYDYLEEFYQQIDFKKIDTTLAPNHLQERISIYWIDSPNMIIMKRNCTNIVMENMEQKQTEFKPEIWLMEEYKLLSAHYFHEDSQLEKTTAFFSTLNVALLTFLGSNFAASNKIALQIMPIVGIIFSIFWLLIHNRIKQCRNYNEKRICEIEKHLHEVWGELKMKPLDIRVLKNWNFKNGKKKKVIVRLIDNIPSSFLEMVLPLSFITIWLILLLK